MNDIIPIIMQKIIDDIPIIFIVHDSNPLIKSYKFNAIDKEKCALVLSKYSEIVLKNDKRQIYDFASGMFNIFMERNDYHQTGNTNFYIGLVKEHIEINLSEEYRIGTLNKFNINEINLIYPIRVYYINFYKH